jgi:hypothetical protein
MWQNWHWNVEFKTWVQVLECRIWNVGTGIGIWGAWQEDETISIPSVLTSLKVRKD